MKQTILAQDIMLGDKLEINGNPVTQIKNNLTPELKGNYIDIKEGRNIYWSVFHKEEEIVVYRDSQK